MVALVRQLCIPKADRAKLQIDIEPLRDGGAILATIAPAAGHRIEDGIAALDEVVDAVRDGQFSQDLLDAVLRNERAGLELLHDDNMTRVTRMGEVYASGQSWAQALADRDDIAKLTRADIIRVAGKYLTANRVVVKTNGRHYDPPKLTRAHIAAIAPDQSAQSKLAAAVLAEESVDIPPRFVAAGRDYQLQQIASGPLLTVLDATSKTYELRLSWDFGWQQVPLLCAAAHAASLGGLTDGNAQARRDRWYARVMAVDITCANDRVALTMTGTDATFADDWQEMQVWLAGNGISAAGWQASAADYVAERRKWYQASLMWILAWYAELGPASPTLAALPSSKLAQASVEAARTALRMLLATRRVTSYIGPRAELDLPMPAVAVHAPPAPIAAKRLPARRPRIVMLDTGPNTPLIMLMRTSLGRIDRHRAALTKLDAEYLATYGGGRLYDALHSGQSTNYLVAARADTELPSDVHVEVYVGAPPDQIAKNTAAALAIVRDHTVDAGYFLRARRTLEQQYRADWITDRDLPGRVSAWLRAGFTGDPRQQDFDDIQRASPDELARTITDLGAAPVYISIFGDLSAVDRGVLAALGTVEIVQPSALVVP
jgi:hypothetical protein